MDYGIEIKFLEGMVFNEIGCFVKDVGNNVIVLCNIEVEEVVCIFEGFDYGFLLMNNLIRDFLSEIFFGKSYFKLVGEKWVLNVVVSG